MTELTTRDVQRAVDNIAKLPASCMHLTDDGKECLIIRGEAGYTPRTSLSVQIAIGFHAGYNAALGVTKAQEAAMLHGSMFGWHTPAADCDNPANAKGVTP